MKPESKTYFDLCICCGEAIPEGRMACYACEIGKNIDAPYGSAKPWKDIRRTLGIKKENKNEPRV